MAGQTFYTAVDLVSCCLYAHVGSKSCQALSDMFTDLFMSKVKQNGEMIKKYSRATLKNKYILE